MLLMPVSIRYVTDIGEGRVRGLYRSSGWFPPRNLGSGQHSDGKVGRLKTLLEEAVIIIGGVIYLARILIKLQLVENQHFSSC